MKTFNWWLKQKRRVRKKCTLFLGKYMSPKEMREWHKRLKGRTGANAIAWLRNEYFKGAR